MFKWICFVLLFLIIGCCPVSELEYPEWYGYLIVDYDTNWIYCVDRNYKSIDPIERDTLNPKIGNMLILEQQFRNIGKP